MKKRKNPTRAEWEIEINLRAWQDPEFKKELLKHPAAALKKLGCESGVDPNRVKIIEESENEQVIVLYPTPRNSSAISKEQLREIAAAKGMPSTENRTCPYTCIHSQSGCGGPFRTDQCPSGIG